MKILVLNSGSSSLKFQLFDMHTQEVIALGIVEQIGEQQSKASMQYAAKKTAMEFVHVESPVANHQAAVEVMEKLLHQSQCLQHMSELTGIGHRVVHGGESFNDPVIIDKKVMKTIRELASLAPLHNPANLIGIEVATQRAPDIPQVAVFDTAFHQSIPEHAYIYGLPYKLYREQKIRRYGFHGTSYQYVTRKTAEYLGKNLSELKIIAFHLGNGASSAAIEFAQSVDTSMGMTPLEGLLMGTRCGDLDPAIPFYLARKTGMTLEELDNLLNKQSGLKGICGSNDMRSIIDDADKGDTQAQLALEIFCYRIKKNIGAYMAVMNGADAIIFTGGIGENASLIRARSCENLQFLGIDIDSDKNTLPLKDTTEIQSDASQVKVLVIPTNEELEIALQTIKLV